jgi:DNA-nicking Smr family endonuclease
MSRDGNRRRGLTAEERVLWNSVTRAIAPLRAPADTPPAADAEEPMSGAATRPKMRGEKPAIASVAPAPPAPAPPPLVPLGRRLRQRVGRGRAEIDARLDLHGLTQAQAHSMLLRFLHTAHARGARLVLVITGKGANLDGRGESEAERGVLRRQLPHWLALPEFRALVIGFEQAHIAHGGEGAWYVSLRRSRAQD